jgi:hypothetical protein
VRNEANVNAAQQVAERENVTLDFNKDVCAGTNMHSNTNHGFAVTFPFSLMLDSIPFDGDEVTSRFLELLISKIQFNNVARVEFVEGDSPKTISVKVRGDQFIAANDIARRIYNYAESHEGKLIGFSTHKIVFYDVIDFKHENRLSFVIAVYAFDLIQ